MLNKFKGYLLKRLVRIFSGSRYFAKYFFIQNRGELLEEVYNYPSIINNGYLHIERVISLAKKLDVKEGCSIVDAGAAGGIISKIFSDNFPKSQIYSFEPVKSSFHELSREVAGIKNIIPINKALGSFRSTSKIHVLDRITSSSLLDVAEKIADPFFAESLKEHNTEEIIISRLDDEIPENANIGILKMDVQGFELEILKGAVNTLKRTDIIILEMQNHDFYVKAPQYFDLDDFLRANDFVLYDQIPSIRKSEKLLEWDSIYVSKSFVERKIVKSTI